MIKKRILLSFAAVLACISGCDGDDTSGYCAISDTPCQKNADCLGCPCGGGRPYCSGYALCECDMSDVGAAIDSEIKADADMGPIEEDSGPIEEDSGKTDGSLSDGGLSDSEIPPCTSHEECNCTEEGTYGCCDKEGSCFCSPDPTCGESQTLCDVPSDAVFPEHEGDLIINEFSAKSPEFVEILNPTSKKIALKGLTFQSSAKDGSLKDRFTLKEGWLSPGHAIVVASKADGGILFSDPQNCDASSQDDLHFTLPDSQDVYPAILKLLFAKEESDAIILDRIEIEKALYAKDSSVARTGDPDTPFALTKSLLPCKQSTPGLCNNGQSFDVGCSVPLEKDPCDCETDAFCAGFLSCSSALPKAICIAPDCQCAECSVPEDCHCTSGRPHCEGHSCECKYESIDDCLCEKGTPAFHDGICECLCGSPDDCSCASQNDFACCGSDQRCYCSPVESCEICTLPENLSGPSASGDLIVNELQVQGDEFIEIVNPGDRAINLSGLSIWWSKADGSVTNHREIEEGWLSAHAAVAIYPKDHPWRWSDEQNCALSALKGITLGFVNQLNADQAQIELRMGETVIDRWSISKDIYNGATSGSITRSPDLTGSAALSSSIYDCLSTTPGLCSTGKSFSEGCSLAAEEDPCSCDSGDQCLDALCTGSLTHNLCESGRCQCFECEHDTDCPLKGDLLRICNAQHACEYQCRGHAQCPACEDEQHPYCSADYQCSCVECTDSEQCSCNSGATPSCNQNRCDCICFSDDQCSCDGNLEPKCDQGHCACESICKAPRYMDLVINEISITMTYNEPAEKARKQDEWIEIVNTSNHPISLKDVKLYGVKTGELLNTNPKIALEDGCLDAGGTLVIRSQAQPWLWVPESSEIESCSFDGAWANGNGFFVDGQAPFYALTLGDLITEEIENPDDPTGDPITAYNRSNWLSSMTSAKSLIDQDTSITRSPDITGDFVKHNSLESAGASSPGYCTNGKLLPACVEDPE